MFPPPHGEVGIPPAHEYDIGRVDHLRHPMRGGRFGHDVERQHGASGLDVPRRLRLSLRGQVVTRGAEIHERDGRRIVVGFTLQGEAQDVGRHVRSVQEGAASGEDPAEARGRLRLLLRLLFQSEHETTTTMVVVVRFD